MSKLMQPSCPARAQPGSGPGGAASRPAQESLGVVVTEMPQQRPRNEMPRGVMGSAHLGPVTRGQLPNDSAPRLTRV